MVDTDLPTQCLYSAVTIFHNVGGLIVANSMR